MSEIKVREDGLVIIDETPICRMRVGISGILLEFRDNRRRAEHCITCVNLEELLLALIGSRVLADT